MTLLTDICFEQPRARLADIPLLQSNLKGKGLLNIELRNFH